MAFVLICVVAFVCTITPILIKGYRFKFILVVDEQDFVRPILVLYK